MSRVCFAFICLLPLVSCVASSSVPRAYRIIASEYGIPTEIFYSVALQESGRTYGNTFIPWPWTLNIEEKSYYFASKLLAEVALKAAMKKQQRVAIGLGQIYWPSHGHVFLSASTVLNPTVNLRYAAMLLSNEYLYTIKKGNANWWVAVGRYHSPSREDLASIYRQRVYQRCIKVFSDRCQRFGYQPNTLAGESA